ncbi:MAG: hypothetical protein FD160_18 [Caulobacteraceae bacterium]|nr:MAG: hypothetical protein FD160_18 [Caulobacteraceae bacterium]
MSIAGPPRFDTAEGRDAYNRELRAVAGPWRLAGLALILAGAGLGATDRYTEMSLPAWTTQAVFALIVAGWALMMFAIFKRTMYHRRRLAGLPEKK